MKIAVDKQPKEKKQKDKQSTRIIFLLDRSISMNKMKEEAVAGYNQYLESQKKVKGKATITLAFFDSNYHVVYNNLDVKEAPTIVCGRPGETIKSPYAYTPQGMTSLFDFIHQTIMSYKDTAKKNEKTIFAILTDGEDTSSKIHNYNTVQAAIREVQDSLKWEVLFLGANMDAKSFAKSVGIKMTNVAQFDYTKKGVSDAINTMAFASSYMRGDEKTRGLVSSSGMLGAAAAAAGADIDMSVAYNTIASGKLKDGKSSDDESKDK